MFRHFDARIHDKQKAPTSLRLHSSFEDNYVWKISFDVLVFFLFSVFSIQGDTILRYELKEKSFILLV